MSYGATGLLLRGARIAVRGGIASSRSAVFGAGRVWKIERLNVFLGVQHLTRRAGRGSALERAGQYREAHRRQSQREKLLAFRSNGLWCRLRDTTPRH